MPDLGALVMDVSRPPGGRRFWLTDDMLPKGRRGQVKPSFKITEVTKVFFARSADWLRWIEQDDQSGQVFSIAGEPLEIKRTETGNRSYTLVDVERLAHALLEHRKITVDQFIAAINIILWMGYSYGILTTQDILPVRVETTHPRCRQLSLADISGGEAEG